MHLNSNLFELNEFFFKNFGFDTAENEPYYFEISSSREFEFERRTYEPLICNPAFNIIRFNFHRPTQPGREIEESARAGRSPSALAALAEALSIAFSPLSESSGAPALQVSANAFLQSGVTTVRAGA